MNKSYSIITHARARQNCDKLDPTNTLPVVHELRAYIDQQSAPPVPPGQPTTDELTRASDLYEGVVGAVRWGDGYTHAHTAIVEALVEARAYGYRDGIRAGVEIGALRVELNKARYKRSMLEYTIFLRGGGVENEFRDRALTEEEVNAFKAEADAAIKKIEERLRELGGLG